MKREGGIHCQVGANPIWKTDCCEREAVNGVGAKSWLFRSKRSHMAASFVLQHTCIDSLCL